MLTIYDHAKIFLKEHINAMFSSDGAGTEAVFSLCSGEISLVSHRSGYWTYPNEQPGYRQNTRSCNVRVEAMDLSLEKNFPDSQRVLPIPDILEIGISMVVFLLLAQREMPWKGVTYGVVVRHTPTKDSSTSFTRTTVLTLLDETGFELVSKKISRILDPQDQLPCK